MGNLAKYMTKSMTEAADPASDTQTSARRPAGRRSRCRALLPPACRDAARSDQTELPFENPPCGMMWVERGHLGGKHHQLGKCLHAGRRVCPARSESHARRRCSTGGFGHMRTRW
jgi:hypothetical protein